jgi:mannose-6-phosphate isomerase-like protein (cupin superfamily)
MIDQIFDVNDIEWDENEYGKTKTIIGKDLFKKNRLRLFVLKPNELFISHDHDFTQCLYFYSGKGKIKIDDAITEVYPGITAIVLPNQFHELENTSKENMEILVFESEDQYSKESPYVDF